MISRTIPRYTESLAIRHVRDVMSLVLLGLPFARASLECPHPPRRTENGQRSAAVKALGESVLMKRWRASRQS